MTMNAKRRKAHDRLAALPGVRSVRRPILAATATSSISSTCAPAIPRTRWSSFPAVPALRRSRATGECDARAQAAGLDVLMVEHRGVGMSRHDDAGADLPPEALTIEAAVDDIAAVLEDMDVESAVIYGASYGTYLASGLGVRHPDRVHAMILDSPLLSADDIDLVREATRRVLWDGDEPETAELAVKVRDLVGQGVLTPAAAQLAVGLYGLAGPDVLGRQLDLLLAGRDWLWGGIAQAAQAVLRAQDAVSARAGSGRPDRLPRAELRRGARRRAARSCRDVPRVRHG